MSIFPESAAVTTPISGAQRAFSGRRWGVFGVSIFERLGDLEGQLLRSRLTIGDPGPGVGSRGLCRKRRDLHNPTTVQTPADRVVEPFAAATSMTMRQWSLDPHSSMSFMAWTATSLWNPRDTNTWSNWMAAVAGVWETV